MIQVSDDNELNQPVKITRAAGFTLIEVSLSLIFIGFILMFLSATLISVLGVYNKGIWLSQVNQTGRQLNTDLGDQTRYSGDVIVKPAAQRLCAGGISFLWNTNTSKVNRFAEESRADTSKLRLVRIIDNNAVYCNDITKYPSRSDSQLTNLLSSSTVIRQFSATQGVGSDTSIPLMRLKIVLSTEGEDRPAFVATDASADSNGFVETVSDKDVDSKSGDWQCGNWVGGKFKPNKNQYCAVAQFNYVVYERGEKK